MSVLHIIYIDIYICHFSFFFLVPHLVCQGMVFFFSLFVSLRHCIFSTKSSQDGGQTDTSARSVAPGKKCTWQLSGTHSRKSHPAEKKARQQAWVSFFCFFFPFFFFFSTVVLGCACRPRSPKPWRGGNGKAGQAPPQISLKSVAYIDIIHTRTTTHIRTRNTHKPTICTKNES